MVMGGRAPVAAGRQSDGRRRLCPARRGAGPPERPRRPGDGAAAEVADAIGFLAASKASFITGQIIGVNGGKTAS